MQRRLIQPSPQAYTLDACCRTTHEPSCLHCSRRSLGVGYFTCLSENSHHSFWEPGTVCIDPMVTGRAFSKSRLRTSCAFPASSSRFAASHRSHSCHDCAKMQSHTTLIRAVHQRGNPARFLKTTSHPSQAKLRENSKAPGSHLRRIASPSHCRTRKNCSKSLEFVMLSSRLMFHFHFCSPDQSHQSPRSPTCPSDQSRSSTRRVECAAQHHSKKKKAL